MRERVYMPLTLEELTADWPTPAKDATMDDLLRMAMLLVVSMPTQHRAMLRDLAEEEFQEDDDGFVPARSSKPNHAPSRRTVQQLL